MLVPQTDVQTGLSLLQNRSAPEFTHANIVLLRLLLVLFDSTF